MLRLVIFLFGIAVAASGLSWLADRPGSLLVNWQGYEVETSVFRAVVMLAFLVGLSILAWSIVSALWRSPASVGAFFNRRRQLRGLEALSGGMIAIGAGDRGTATRFAVQAGRALPNEPLTQLLRAQAAQLSGDRPTARRMFEAMLTQPETEQLGLRGLFLEAEREGEREAARQFAERSVELNPQLGWAVDALFDLQCKASDWAGALQTLTLAKKHQHHGKSALDRKRAVLMTARAQALEDSDPNRAMSLAIEAHHLAHDLIPAAELAGRMLAARNHTKRAAKIIERAWRRAPHPDLALVYAYVRPGDSPRDRLDRVKRLAQLNPHSIETPVAIATAAVEAKDWAVARRALEPLDGSFSGRSAENRDASLLGRSAEHRDASFPGRSGAGPDASRMTQRVCMLMARIEGEEHADKGKVREWLARAVHAPRDPAWVADGAVADRWAPVSPVTGAFDAFQWRVPADALDTASSDLLAAKLAELVKLGAPVAETAKGSFEREAAGVGSARAAEGVTVVAVDRPGPVARRFEREPERQGAPAPSRDAEDLTAVPVSGRPGPLPRPVRVGSELRPPASANGGRAGNVSSVEVVTGPALAEKKEATAASVRVNGGPEAKTGGPAGAAASVKVDTTGATRPATVAAEKKPLDPSVFIAPRSPDDPGVGVDDGTDGRKPARIVASGGQR